MNQSGDAVSTREVILDCPYYLLTRASLATTHVLKQELGAAGAAGVRPAYIGVLMCLWSEDGRNVGELGRCAGLEPSTMTGLLDRMARDGLLTREPDPDDRRAHRIHLTDIGRAAEEPVQRVVDGVLRQMTTGIDDEDVTVFKEILRQVVVNANRRT